MHYENRMAPPEHDPVILLAILAAVAGIGLSVLLGCTYNRNAPLINVQDNATDVKVLPL